MIAFMKPSQSSARALETRSAWLELAGGTGSALERWFGEPVLDEHLPGLGEIAGWGFVDESVRPVVSGALYTGFLPEPTSVSLMLTVTCVSDTLDTSSLATLLGLPRGFLQRLAIRSLISGRPAIRVVDRGKLVGETGSEEAAILFQRLVSHLVIGGQPTAAEVEAEARPTLRVRLGDANIVSHATYGNGRPAPGEVEIVDWR